ncbi:hypothetical protein [Dyella terrae]|uniref:hypothetical protein n=1 Tax=Dyella terrae TaxID=522259 RepID=UPI001EFC350E|nr:hypothetical protein [Dyella terrae]ULU24444.1 hypothetical protein DYST_01360 [Dyella terrae]
MTNGTVALSGSPFWNKRALPIFMALAFTIISINLLARGEAVSVAVIPMMIGSFSALLLWAVKARFMDIVLDNGNSLTAIRGARRVEVPMDHIESVKVITGRGNSVVVRLAVPCAFGRKIYFSPTSSTWPDSPVTERMRQVTKSR